MDNIDEEILRSLRDNAKTSSKRTARKLGIPLSTLYSRIKRLEKGQLIETYSIKINWRKLGYPTLAYVLVFVDTAKLKELKKTQLEIVDLLKKFPFVDEANVITGDADIIMKVRAKDTRDLGRILTEKIQNIAGITKTKTLMCLD